MSLNASDVGAQFDGERAKTVAGRGGSGKGLRRRRGRDRRVIQRCCYAVEKHLPACVCLKTSSTVLRFCFLWGQKGQKRRSAGWACTGGVCDLLTTVAIAETEFVTLTIASIPTHMRPLCCIRHRIHIEDSKLKDLHFTL